MACSPETLTKFSQIASDKIGESKANLVDAVAEVKRILAEKYEDLRLPPDSDHLFERSLRYKNFDVTEAATHLHSYFKILRSLRESHADMYFLPSKHQEEFLDTFAFIPLKNRDSKGRKVLIINYDQLPGEVYDLDKGLAMVALMMDELTRTSVETQRIGIVLVVHLKEYTLGHAKQFTLSRIRALIKLLQGSYPAKCTGFHIVRAPTLFNCTYAVIKPFFVAETKKRIHMHGNELTDLHKHVSPDILPEFLGGKLSNEESVDADFFKQFVTQDEYYKDLFKFGYMKDTDL